MCHMQYCEQTRYTRIARYLNEAERVKEPKEKKKRIRRQSNYVSQAVYNEIWGSNVVAE